MGKEEAIGVRDVRIGEKKFFLSINSGDGNQVWPWGHRPKLGKIQPTKKGFGVDLLLIVWTNIHTEE